MIIKRKDIHIDPACQARLLANQLLIEAHSDTFRDDKHTDLNDDYVLANPPFNDSDWRGELLKDDKRWAYGVPPDRQLQGVH